MTAHSLASLLFSRCSVFKLQVLAALVIFTAPAFAQDTQPDVRPLAVGEKVERTVLGQEVQVYTIELKRGQVLRVNFLERGADVAAVALRNADRQKASAVANFGSGFMQESLTLIVKQDGAYGLVVRAQQVSNGDAKYEMIASLSDLATEKDTQRVHAEQLLEEANQTYINGDKERMPLAIAKLEESLKIWRLLGEPYWRGVTTELIGGIYFRMENPSRAETYLTEALKSFEALQNEPQVAAISVMLGTLYTTTNNEEKARFYLSQAARLSRNLGDKRMEEILRLMNLRSSTQENENQDFARELAAARAKKDKPGEAAVWAKTLFRYATNDSIDDNERRRVLERAEREALPGANHRHTVSHRRRPFRHRGQHPGDDGHARSRSPRASAPAR